MSSSSIEKANVHFHAEIGLLKKALADKHAELSVMRTAVFKETDRRGEIEDVVLAWQDKFERLYESHKKVQKINQTLEDKLLKLVDRNSGERAQLTSDCATLNIRLTQANYNISSLQRELDRYKQDINLAIQLLHCKPDNFLPQKVNSLPMEMQAKVAAYIKFGGTDSECSNENPAKGKYQILPTNEDGTFPISFDQNKNGEIKVSPVVVAKFLESELKPKTVMHCDTCFCAKKHLAEVEGIQMIFNIGTQTDISTLSSPAHTNNPYLIKVKSSDSVMSTKSSVSDFVAHNDKNYSSSKVDDLKVNPILGHHRLCEHTKNFNCQSKTEEIPIPINSSERKIFRNREKVVDIKPLLNENNISHAASNESNGSNNSLWSKTSNREGAKLFENFNRNLIKAMRAENPRKITPRICALKVQDGTNNIMLDSPLGETKTYTRRPRLLDEELLDDEKDISGNVPMNFESSQSSMVLGTESNQSNNIHEIFSTNKTDSEKFNEIQCKESLPPIENIAPTVLTDRDVSSVGKNVKNTETFCETASGEIEVHDSIQNILLRRQQLTRVAEWVQNSSNISLPNSPIQKLDSFLDQKTLEFEKQLLLNNQAFKEISEKHAQNKLDEKLNQKMYVEPENLSIKSVDLEEDGKLDLVQMEYNVKKFLLGTNLQEGEWNRSLFNDSFASKSDCNDDEVFFNKNHIEGSYKVQRTETNL